MKALTFGLAALLLCFSSITVTFAYKRKLQAANRYIEYLKQDCAANHSVRVGAMGRYEITKGTNTASNDVRFEHDGKLALLVRPMDQSRPLNLSATNLVIVTKHVPIMSYDSDENFIIRFAR